jgi:hypothetical protein
MALAQQVLGLLIGADLAAAVLPGPLDTARHLLHAVAAAGGAELGLLMLPGVAAAPRRQKNIRQLRLRDVQGTTLRDERCSRLDLIGRHAPPGLCSPGFAHQGDRNGIWLTRPLGVATVWCHVGQVSNHITSVCAAGRLTRIAVEERTLGGVPPLKVNVRGFGSVCD